MVVIKNYQIPESCQKCELTYRDSIGKLRCVFSKTRVDEMECKRKMQCRLFLIDEE